jgi:hypothetical protein
MKSSHGLVTALTTLLGLSSFGCAASEGGVSGEPGDGSEARGTWRYVSGSFQGQVIPVVDGYPVTLKIEGEVFSGDASCNHYGGRLRDVAASEWRASQMYATEVNCASAAEAAAFGYFKALRAAYSITISGEGNLRLFGAGADLVFTPRNSDTGSPGRRRQTVCTCSAAQMDPPTSSTASQNTPRASGDKPMIPSVTTWEQILGATTSPSMPEWSRSGRSRGQEPREVLGVQESRSTFRVFIAQHMSTAQAADILEALKNSPAGRNQ